MRGQDALLFGWRQTGTILRSDNDATFRTAGTARLSLLHGIGDIGGEVSRIDRFEPALRRLRQFEIEASQYMLA